LDLDLAAKMTNGAPDHLAIVEGQWRCLVGAPVGNAETAAQIETPDLVAVGTQHLGKFRELAEGLLEGSKRRELAADMDIDPHNLDPGQPRRFGIDIPRPGDRDAELVLALAGGDLGMG